MVQEERKLGCSDVEYEFLKEARHQYYSALAKIEHFREIEQKLVKAVSDEYELTLARESTRDSIQILEREVKKWNVNVKRLETKCFGEHVNSDNGQK